MKKNAKSMKTALFLVCFGVFLSACSLMDIKPAAGFPAVVEGVQASPELLPSDAYDFHNNPRL